MKYLATIMLLGCMPVYGQSYNLSESNLRPHQMTDAPSSSRYEFIQSHIAAKNTFKIDKFLGNVYQIVQTEENNLTWELIQKDKHPLDSAIKGKVNYQLFTSGMAAKFTFLLNVNTGATWQLTEDTKTKILYWSPIV